ncbi:hypothetical protein [Carnobacterium pleistocenium]|uniref:hypothetical protein n=1 Tax=Carnobacterium pleistocenium TaxID=181073 RepID=UPI0005573B3A|nr:hypothetical protein [Carnobacterium pleistocenium]
MAKLLTLRDWNFNSIGSIFELDEVIPVFEQENRADKNGEIIQDREGKPRNFSTDVIIGYNYSVTILDGNFRKKSTQIKILNPKPLMTNQDIMKKDSVKVQFVNLECSMQGNPMYYRAEMIDFV